MDSSKKRILILGSGFAGIYAAVGLFKHSKKRGNIEIVMISENDHFLFVPLLHEVATGNLLPSSIMQSVRLLPGSCLDDFVPGIVTGVDFDNKTVSYRNPKSEESDLNHFTLSYDYLVMGLGSDTNYYNTPGAREFALPLKSMEHARELKNRILQSFESSQMLTEEMAIRARLRFVIVGGGPTGVELAGEISDLLSGELRQAYRQECNLASVILVERGDRPVKELGEWFGRKTAEILKEKGVEVITNKRVSEVLPNGFKIDGEFMRADTVIWAAGVKAQELELRSVRPVEKDTKTARIKVNNYLHIPSYPNVYVAGDMAWVCDIENRQPYPMRAQFAVREGKIVARNILSSMKDKPPRGFKWQDKGIIVSLGKGGSLASVMGIKFTGILGWIMYRGAYLLKMLGARNKIRTAMEWTLNFFNPRDISEI